MKKEKNYKVTTNVNNQITVSTNFGGRVRSASSDRLFYTYQNNKGEIIVKLETKAQTIKRLCQILGVAY